MTDELEDVLNEVERLRTELNLLAQSVKRLRRDEMSWASYRAAQRTMLRSLQREWSVES